jgi:hypothetical protein
MQLLMAITVPSLVVVCALLLALILAETLARSNACTKRQLGEAEVRAQTLLDAWLSPAQLAQYNRNGYFEVTGSHSRTLYRIRRDRQMNIDELDGRGARVAVWCFEPKGRLPIGDVMLAQKLALETDEQAALAIANRYRGTGYTG